jgi:hypothetical protein
MALPDALPNRHGTTGAIPRHATATYGLSFCPPLRGKLWRSIQPFNRRPSRDPARMSRQRAHNPGDRRERLDAADDDLCAPAPAIDLYDYDLTPARIKRREGRPKNGLQDWIVTDDWPEHIPVSEAEIDLFERWFGDVFDELFGPST